MMHCLGLSHDTFFVHVIAATGEEGHAEATWTIAEE
jgi:hypothetical protein